MPMLGLHSDNGVDSSSAVLTEDKKRELADTYGALNPVTLLKGIRQSVEPLCAPAGSHSFTPPLCFQHRIPVP